MKYIIITPAYNEADYLSATIESVLAQTVLPSKWVIVDDGSIDGTADVIKKYTKKYDWIKYIKREKVAGQAYYASNVYAIMEGYKTIQNEQFDYLAILDADITLPLNYYEQIFDRFDNDQKLGIASGVYQDLVGGKLRKILSDRRSTPKAIMVFRKKCFEEIGGFVSLKYGGEDTCSCIMARMKGFKSWSFPELCVLHNKPVGTGHSGSMLKIRFRNGLNEFFLASHPLFILLKTLRRCVKERPYILGGLARLAGFVYGYFLRQERQIADDVVRFTRKEQLQRVFNFNRIKEGYAVNGNQSSQKLKICLAASAGGHLSQLLKLSNSWKGYDVFSVTTTEVTKKVLQKYGEVYVVGECNHRYPIRVMRVLLRCVKIILKQKPDVIISTGAAAGCILCFLAKLYGAKIIWIDSITNVKRMSLSGRMVRHIADMYHVQWPELADQYSNVEYVGPVI